SGTPVLCINIYNRPGPFNQQSDTIHRLHNVLSELHSKYRVIIAGDLNAQIELGSAFAESTQDEDVVWNIPTLQFHSTPRIPSPRVSQIIDLAFTYGLRFGNGRFPNDNPARPTFFRGNYSSCLDYVILDLRVWHLITNVEVGLPRTSDHAPLQIAYNIALFDLPTGLVDRNDLLKLSSNRRAVKWPSFLKSNLLNHKLGVMMSCHQLFEDSIVLSSSEIMSAHEGFFAELKELFTKPSKSQLKSSAPRCK
ncbi:hypothetical protein NDU88_005398, partial [Pleurodeles waltl]